MNRDEFALCVKQEAMDLVYNLMDALKAQVSPEGLFHEGVDTLEGEMVRAIDELTTHQLIQQRHDLCNVDFVGEYARKTLIGRFL